MRLIDADALYEKTAELEAQALHMCDVTMHDDDLTEWRKWSAILSERSAFKYDLADAPTVDAIPVEWINRWYEKYMYAEVGDLLNDWMAERKEE